MTKPHGPAYNIILGLCMIGGGFWARWLLTDMEQNGGRRRIPILVTWSYRLLGKNGPVILMSVLGGLILYWGIRDLVKKNQAPVTLSSTQR
ncbi:MAG: hypothetical protein NTY77_18955 [Elusimicrobia bacterium]|nr:hypothetical protein [Elusimicrobiota bacterium]